MTIANLLRQHWAALRLLLVFTVLLGVGYPLSIWLIAQLPGLSAKAQGSIIRVDGQPVGSRLIGQSFTDDAGFKPSLLTQVCSRSVAVAEAEHLGKEAGARPFCTGGAPTNPAVPADAVTASASGLDPDISPAYADIQVARVARARHITPARVRDVVAENRHGRDLGVFGEPRVNVVALNLELDQKYPVSS